MRIKKNKEFYRLLQGLENYDPQWFVNVGKEIKPNVFVDDGNYKVPVEKIMLEREVLLKLRKIENPDLQYRIWRTNERKEGIRLYVTFYRQFDLTYKQIAELLNIPYSTLRHDYPELRIDETISNDYKPTTDVFGRELMGHEF